MPTAHAPLALFALALTSPLIAQGSQLEPDPIQRQTDAHQLTWGELSGFLPVPIGIPRAALVPQGHVGVAVRVQQTSWDGMRDGRDDISNAEQQAQFGFTTFGEELEENRVEVDVQYGLEGGWRVFATLPFLDRELDWTNAGGGAGTASASGLGDVVLGAAYTPVIEDDRLLDLQLGLSVPTGDFDARGDYAGVTDTVLPYAVQIGTGTLDLHPSVTFQKRERSFVWGARLGGRFHTEKNSDGWARSDEARLDLWATTPLADRLVGTARLQGNWWGDLHGDSDELTETRSALEDPHRQRGSLLQVVVGVAWDILPPATHRNRLELEFGIPFDEWLDGPALSRDTSLLLGWRALL